jgi:transposase
LATAPGHPFYERLNAVLDAEGFDRFVESLCARFYAPQFGRPSLTPGIYFRSLLVGYFEGLRAERGIAWRLADSLTLRSFVGIALDEYTPEHSTISRTRRLIDLDTHAAVFAWVLDVLARRGLIVGKRVAIDATTLEANAAMRSIVQRDTGESYTIFSLDWPRHRASTRRCAKSWRGWTASARSARRTRSGRVQSTRMRELRR